MISAIMFGLGFGEILIILVLALILLGPAKLPEVAKQLGKGLRDFKRASDDLKNQFEREMYSEDRPKPKPALVQPNTPAAPAPGQVPAATSENVPGLEAATAEPGQLKPEPPPAQTSEPGMAAPRAAAAGEAGEAP